MIIAYVGSRGYPWAGTNRAKWPKIEVFSHIAAICLKILFLPIFFHLCLLMGNPLTPPLISLTNKLSLSAVAAIAKECDSRLLPPYLPANCMKIQFLAILLHLCLLMGNPLTPPLLSLTKILSLSSVAMISMERKPFKANSLSFSPPISCHYEALSGNMAFPTILHHR